VCLASLLDRPLDELADVLSAAHPESVGRFRSELSFEELADVEREAGSLLRRLGYT
jgi:hypothetical protein